MCTSIVRGSRKSESPQTRDSSCSRVNTRPGLRASAPSTSNSTNVRWHSRSTDLDRAPAEVDLQVARRQRLLVLGAGGAHLRPSQGGLDARAELAHGERLGDVVVGPQLQPEHLVDLLGLGGQHDDRHRAAGPQAPAHLQPVHPRHHHVQHHQVERRLGEAVERLAPVGGQDDLVARPCAADRRAASESTARRRRAGCGLSGSGTAGPATKLRHGPGAGNPLAGGAPSLPSWTRCSTRASTGRPGPGGARRDRGRILDPDPSRRPARRACRPTRSTAIAHSPSCACWRGRFPPARPAATGTPRWPGACASSWVAPACRSRSTRADERTVRGRRELTTVIGAADRAIQPAAGGGGRPRRAVAARRPLSCRAPPPCWSWRGCSRAAPCARRWC